MEVVGSISAAKLNISLNAQMFDTGLTDAISSNIQNEVQNIVVNSTIEYESYVREIIKKFQKNNPDREIKPYFWVGFLRKFFCIAKMFNL